MPLHLYLKDFGWYIVVGNLGIMSVHQIASSMKAWHAFRDLCLSRRDQHLLSEGYIPSNNLCCFFLLRSSLWLQFKPHQIAAGAAYLAAKFMSMDLTSWKNLLQEFQTPSSIIKGIFDTMLNVAFIFETSTLNILSRR
ncbi:unnamed protein product [Ilex paraguariensis]|uniref:Cyclin N-terminal domain-containing protein n=1 Tax=Ilex paraguariensis TaxID=185542 RepID=A0ABC8UZ82_9AQUA